MRDNYFNRFKDIFDNCKESKEFLECANPALTGNYSLFEYDDGYLTAYNEDAKVDYYFTVEHFLTKFLKQTNPL
jgi:hypothetical protein